MTDSSTLGATIDALYSLRQMRIEMARKVDEMKGQEAAMKREIMEVLDETGLGKATGAVATCGIMTSVVPVIEDWDTIYAWIRENDRFDLLQKRISVTAWREMALDGTVVPGTAVDEARDISLTKAHRN